MKRTVKRINIILILLVIAWFYLLSYARLMLSPFSWRDTDINKSGFVTPSEADYFGSYGTRQYIENGKYCTEYFALKDGLPLKKSCK